MDETEMGRRRLLADLYDANVPAPLGDRILRTSDVAVLFQVSERTVSDWARRGRIPLAPHPGGHLRYPAREIQSIREAAERDVVPDATSRE